MSAVEFYAGLVADRSFRRSVMRDASKLVEVCGNGHETEEIRAAVMDLYRRSAIEQDKASPCLDGAALMRLYEESARAPETGRVKLFIPPLDRMIDGMRPGEVLTVIARPRVGKSSLASQVILDLARSNKTSLFVSLEMPAQQVIERLIMQAGGIRTWEAQRIARTGFDAASPALRSRLEPIRERVCVVDRGKSSIADVEIAVERAESMLGIRPALVAIDYLGLLSVGARNVSLYERISEAAIDVKSFAKSARVAVLLTCQAGRSSDRSESEGAGRLGLNAARDSGQVEEAADFLLTMWRPELSPNGHREVEAGRIECSLAKNRRGRMGDFSMRIDRQSTAITTIEDRAEQMEAGES